MIIHDKDFKPFDIDFQRELLAILLQNADFYTRYDSIWSATYFDNALHKQIAQAFLTVRLLGSEHPARITLRQELVKDYDHTAAYPANVLTLLAEVDVLYELPLHNIKYSLEVVREWARNHAIVRAVETSINLIGSGKPEEIRALIDKAIEVGKDLDNQGITVNSETRCPSVVLLKARGSALPLGLNTLDLKMEGGIRPGEMLAVIGGPGSFKSGTLLHMGMAALMPTRGKKITYITLEMPEVQVYARYCYRITQLGKGFLTGNKEEFDKKFEREISQYRGALHIKAFGSGTLELSALRSYLDHLENQGHITDLLIVDYPQIMAKPVGIQDHISTGRLYAGVRAIATDRKIPVLVAAQTNRDAFKDPEKVTLQHISATMDIARHSDYVVALMQTEKEHQCSKMRQKLIKNRNDASGVVVSIEVKYEICELIDHGPFIDSDVTEEETSSKASYHDDDKRTMRENLAARTRARQNGF